MLSVSNFGSVCYNTISTVVSVPKLFLETLLFKPYVPKSKSHTIPEDDTSVKFLQKSFREIRNTGATPILKKVALAIREHPLESIAIVGTVALRTSIESSSQSMLTSAFLIVQFIKNSKNILSFQISLPSNVPSDSYVKLAFYNTILQTLSSLSMASAYEWNSYAKARAAYNSDGCSYPMINAINPADQCLRSSKAMEECTKLLPEMESDRYTFKKHYSGAVSIVQLNKKTCILTSLKSDTPVTKTCFPSNGNLNERTTEILPGMTLDAAQEGLEVGKSIRHIALLGKDESCGTFHTMDNVSIRSPFSTCIVSTPKPGDAVTETCFDPETPSDVIVTELDTTLQADNGGKPISMVFRNQWPTLDGKGTCSFSRLEKGGKVTQVCHDPQNPSHVSVKAVDVDLGLDDDKPISIVVQAKEAEKPAQAPAEPCLCALPADKEPNSKS